MGADFRDINNDGYDDLWVTAIESDTFPLFRNRGAAGDFMEITYAAGIASATRAMSGWSNGIFDLDNDGWKDLLVVRGHVVDNLVMYAAQTRRTQHGVAQSGKWQVPGRERGRRRRDFQVACRASRRRLRRCG